MNQATDKYITLLQEAEHLQSALTDKELLTDFPEQEEQMRDRLDDIGQEMSELVGVDKAYVAMLDGEGLV